MKEYKYILTTLGTDICGNKCFEKDVNPVAEEGWRVIKIHCEDYRVHVFLERELCEIPTELR